MSDLKCAYCGREAELVTGAVIYPHRPDLAHKWLWRCEPCKAWVGCHKDTTKPLGRLANDKLRKAKMTVHHCFDQLWKREAGGTMKRKEAYRWLALEMKLSKEECHIGMFSVQQCDEALEATGRITQHLDNGMYPPCPCCKSIEHSGVWDCHSCYKPQCEDCSCNNMHFRCEALATGGSYIGPSPELDL